MRTGTNNAKRSSVNGKHITGRNQKTKNKSNTGDVQTCADFHNTLQTIFEHSLDNRLTLSDLKRICAKNKQRSRSWFWILLPILCAIVVSLCGRDYFGEVYKTVTRSVSELECLIEQNEFSAEVTRPIYDCKRCQDIITVPIETDMSPEYFERTYAYTGIPVVIRNSTGNWTAHDVFSVNYFKTLYNSDKNTIETATDHCQFLPFFTGFDNLVDGLNTMDDQVNLSDKRWYMGWSNCVPKVEDELRKHYRKPDFLPQGAANKHGDWIFLGGSGYGAPPHIDSVGRPSWQAQIRGRKTWYLDPPAECDHVCHYLTVDMDVGDIITLDTDVWYHSTYIHPGEISITIGCEFD